MNPEKVIFGFFIVLALTLNFIGDIDNPEHHHVMELFAVVIVNLIATASFGDRSQMGRCCWPPAWWPCCSSSPPCWCGSSRSM